MTRPAWPEALGFLVGVALALVVLLSGCGAEPCPAPCGEVCCASGQRCEEQPREEPVCVLRGLP